MDDDSKKDLRDLIVAMATIVGCLVASQIFITHFIH